MKQVRFLISLLFLLGLTACAFNTPAFHVVIVPVTPVVVTATPSPTVAINPTLAATVIPPSATATATRTSTATASPSPTITSTPSQVIVTATTLVNLNVRSGPATSYTPVLRVLPANTMVTVIGRNLDGTWLYIAQAGFAPGWVSANAGLISISGNVASLPVIAIDPTPTQETRSRISYNFNGLVALNKPLILRHLSAMCVTGALMMDNLEFANDIYNALLACDPSTVPIIVHRSYDYDEGDEWAREPISENINQWNREGYKNLVRYCTNEPSFGGTRSVEEFVAYHIQLMASARANGITLACGNFGVGVIRWEDIAAGKYDPFLRAINQYGHYLACHDYTQTVLAFGVGQWPREYLHNPEKVKPSNWPTAEQLPAAMLDVPFYGKIWPPYYHLRRCDWFLIRADQLSIPRPRIILTEFGWDSLADIKQSLEPLRWRFGLNQYMFDLRGINTYPKLWAYYWPQWTFAQAACEQLKWADEIYPADYLTFDLFTWTGHPHWLQTDMSGVENPSLFEMHSCLEDYFSPN